MKKKQTVDHTAWLQRHLKDPIDATVTAVGNSAQAQVGVAL